MTERFIQHFDCSLRSDFTRFRTTYSVGDREDGSLAVGQERILVQGAPLIQTTIRERCRLNCECLGVFAHWTASNLMGDELFGAGRSAITRSRALRLENAINIPSIAKLVIKLKPP